MQGNFPARPRQALGWEMQPSRAQHPHEVSEDLQGVFISLARKRVTPPPSSQKHSPGTRNIGRLQSNSSSNNTSHLRQRKSFQLQWKAQLFLNQQSCDREETIRTAGKTPSPHTGSQGCSIALPTPKHCSALAMPTHRAVSPCWGLVCLNLLQLSVDLRQSGTFCPFSPGAEKGGVCGTQQVKV